VLVHLPSRDADGYLIELDPRMLRLRVAPRCLTPWIKRVRLRRLQLFFTEVARGLPALDGGEREISGCA
jgi:hypothetical protein